jgi:hypothetical protein
LHCTIPDDAEQSTYRFIIVAAKRARQLQGGARPVLSPQIIFTLVITAAAAISQFVAAWSTLMKTKP